VLSDCFGVSSTALNRFESYLSDWTQSFVYTGHTTAYFPVTCSVPQGSVLGPLGFIAYTDDLTAVSEKHNVHSHMYTDDTQLYDSSPVADAESVRHCLTSCVSEVAKWCASRRLQLNDDKTEMIWFGLHSSLATTARPECSCPTGVRLESLRPCHADPDPAALAAGQLQNKVQAVLPRPRHPLRSQPGA